jgi:hypothetical protein
MSTAIDITAPVVWEPCGTCWGQRQIFDNPNGEGLVPHACPTCLGLGERAVVVTASRHAAALDRFGT